MRKSAATGWHVTRLHELAALLAVPLPPVMPRRVGEPIQPFVIGAHLPLLVLARPDCRRRVRMWLGRWTASTQYLEALSANGARRHDLMGRPVAPVTPEQAQAARERLEARRHNPSP